MSRPAVGAAVAFEAWLLQPLTVGEGLKALLHYVAEALS